MKFLFLLALLVLLVVGYASTRPDTFRIERSTLIKASPEKIYPLIADFAKWQAWSPWEKKDPAMKRSQSGPASGVGAVYGWEGNKDVGSGRMEVVEALASSRIRIKLDFLKPFEAHNMAEFSLVPKGEQTEVVWAMYGPQPLIARIMSLFFSMEKMVGPDFEQGLASLKEQAEKP